jgi:polysaccharide chain length determinant protein (PEP-CTERM system associated)
VKSNLENLRGALSDARSRVELLRRELEQTPEMLTQQGGGTGPPSNIDARIMELRAKLDDLKSRYTEQHPDVARAQRQLDSLMQEKSGGLAGPAGGAQTEEADGASSPRAADEGQSGGVKIPNPTFTNLRLQLVEARSKVDSLRQQVKREEQKLENLQSKRDEVFEVEAKLKQLQRDYNVVQERYQTLLNRLETAELSEERNEQAEQVKFRMIESPQVPSAPSGPNRPAFLGAVFVVSIGAGCGLSLFLGIIKTSFGSVQHIRREYDVPVLGTLSRQPGPGEQKWRILDMYAFACLSVAFVASFAGLLMVEQLYGLGGIYPSVLNRFGFNEMAAAVRSWAG